MGDVIAAVGTALHATVAELALQRDAALARAGAVEVALASLAASAEAAEARALRAEAACAAMRAGIVKAMDMAANHWDEWGTRALATGEILEATLNAEGETVP